MSESRETLKSQISELRQKLKEIPPEPPKPPGRPALPESERGQNRSIRFRPAEIEELEAEAESSGTTFSYVVRQRCGFE